jgi:hypothetical protein
MDPNRAPDLARTTLQLLALATRQFEFTSLRQRVFASRILPSCIRWRQTGKSSYSRKNSSGFVRNPVRRFVLGSYVLGLLVITVLTLMVHNLRTSFDAALDTAGSIQVRFIECEGDRLKLQISLQSCSITETLKLDDGHDTEYRRTSARNK